MSTPTPSPPLASAAGNEPFVYSTNPQAVRTRIRRAAKRDANAALPSSLECRNSDSVASNSDAPSGIVRQKRKRPEDYVQSESAILQRARYDNMTPEERSKNLERQRVRNDVVRACKHVEHQQDSEDLEDLEYVGDDEQQNLSVDEGAHATQDR
jgi:hypothetical protein